MKDKILVLNGQSYATPAKGLGTIVYQDEAFFDHPEDFKLVLFTGGEDVSPELYGETSPRRMCGSNLRRDTLEKQVFDLALKHDVLMTGICRGIQFLNVMAGGRLMHHVAYHAGTTHLMELLTGEQFRVNSLHHQMAIPHDDAIIAGWSHRNLSTKYVGDGDCEISYYGLEVEAAIFPKIKAFGVQYHPEMMASDTTGARYYRQMIKNAFTMDWGKFIDGYVGGLHNVQLFEVRERHSAACG